MLISGEEYKEYLKLKENNNDAISKLNKKASEKESKLRSEIWKLEDTISILKNQIEPLQLAFKEFKATGIYVKINRETEFYHDSIGKRNYIQNYQFMVSSKYLSNKLRLKLSSLIHKVSGYELSRVKNINEEINVELNKLRLEINSSNNRWINRKKLLRIINSKK